MEVDPAPPENPESVTRCPCGDNEDNDGFMIQCETCFVWQHGECIGINPKDVPEEYFCELCQPSDPVHVKRAELFKLAQAGKLPAAPARRVRPNEKGRSKQPPNPNDKSGKRKRPPTKPSRPRQQNGPVPAAEEAPIAPAPPAVIEETNPNKRAKRPDPTTDAQTDMAAAAIAIASLGAAPIAPAIAQPAAVSDGSDAGANGARPAASREDRKIQWQIELIDKLAQDKKAPAGKQKAPTTPTTRALNGPDGTEEESSGQPSRPSITVPPQSASKRPLVRGHASPSSAHSGSSSPTFISGVMAAPPPKPRHLHPLNPSYLGHKNWLLTAYKDSVRPQNGKTTPLNESALPINKRLLIACAPSASASSSTDSKSGSAGPESSMNGAPRLLGALPAHPRFSSLQDTHTPLRRGPHAATDILGLSSSAAALFGSPAPSLPHPQSPIPQHFLEWAPQRRMMMGSHQTGNSSPIDEEGRSPPQTPGDAMQRGVSASSMDVDMQHVASSADHAEPAPSIPSVPSALPHPAVAADAEMAPEAPSPPPTAQHPQSQLPPTMNGIKAGPHTSPEHIPSEASSSPTWMNGHVSGHPVASETAPSNGPVLPSSFAADHSLGLLQEQTKSVHSGTSHSGTVAPL